MRQLFLSLAILATLQSVGQNITPALKHEVTPRNGIMYFQGKPFTGVAFERGGPKDIILYEANYANGILDGTFKETHPNGAKKFDAVYRNGKLDDGTYYVYDRTGQKAEGKVYSNGKLIRLEAYTAGKIHGIVRDYDANGNVVKETPYTNGKKEGVQKELNTSGIVVAERHFKADVQESCVKLSYHPNGNLRQRAECNDMGTDHGIKETFFESGALQKKSKYENGIEVSVLVENADPNTTVGKLIGNGRYIYMCDRMNGTDTVYVMVTFNFQGAGASGDIQANILNRLKGRMKEVLVDDLGSHRNKAVRYELSFKNPNTGTAYVAASTSIIGTPVPAGYRGTASVDCQIKDLKANTTVRTKTLTGQTVRYDDKSAAQNNAASVVKGPMVDDMAYGFFKLTGKVTSTIESNRKGLPTRVEVDLGSAHNLGNGVSFNVYEQPGPNRSKVGLLILQDVLGEYSSRCKVKDGEDVIKRLMDSGKPIYIEAIFNF